MRAAMPTPIIKPDRPILLRARYRRFIAAGANAR
jgi:hypothetical protein